MDEGIVEKRLGQRVALLRKRIGLSQKQLSTRVGASGTSTDVISRLERGVKIPKVRRLDEIAVALNVEIAELFRFSEAQDTSSFREAIWSTEHDQPRRRERERAYRAKKSIAAILANRSPSDVEAALQLLKVAFSMKHRRDGK